MISSTLDLRAKVSGIRATYACYGLCFVLVALSMWGVSEASAASRRQLEKSGRAALAKLYSTEPASKALAGSAKGILVFPEIVKGGFIAGGAYGEGVLMQNGKAKGFYRSVAASYGLQAGLQKYGYALFFMHKDDLSYLNKSEGWEVGVGPSITVIDKGRAGSFTTTTARSGVYAFFFEQKGLMAGLGLQGTKLSQIYPDP